MVKARRAACGSGSATMNRRPLACCLAVFAVLVAAARPPRDEPIELKLAPYVGPLRTVQATVGGQTGAFLFDTGGGATVLSLATAKAAGCTVFGRGTGFRHDGTRVDGARGGPLDVAFGGYVRRGEVGVLDIDAMLQGLPKVAGIASIESFAGRVLTVDLAQNRLVVETAASLAQRTRTAKELRVRVAHQAGGASLDLFVAIDGKHGPLWFELDSGNTQPVLVAPHAWVELGLEAPAAGQAKKCELPVTGLGKVACEVVSKEMIYDGLLNAAFCERFVLTLDLDRGRAWALANRGP